MPWAISVPTMEHLWLKVSKGGVPGRWDTTIHAYIGILAVPRTLIHLWNLLGWGEIQ